MLAFAASVESKPLQPRDLRYEVCWARVMEKASCSRVDQAIQIRMKECCVFIDARNSVASDKGAVSRVSPRIAISAANHGADAR